MQRPVYLDANATTPLLPEVRSALEQALASDTLWGNPSSSHKLGRSAKELIETARLSVSERTGFRPEELVFTSGGSEANSLALQGAFFQQFRKGPFVLVTSTVEHSSVLDLAKWLRDLGDPGVQVHWLEVNRTGQIDLDVLEHKLRTCRPSLVSVMTANNETGVLYPIPEIAVICHREGALLHTDAVQAFGKVPSESWMAADFVSFSAHKVGGPKGVGALRVHPDHPLSATHFGGSQEIKRRGGTENTLGILGFGVACGPAWETLDPKGLRTLRDQMETRLVNADLGMQILCQESPRLPNTTSLQVHGIPSQILLGVLDLHGFAVSAGSACSSGSISPSHVLLAMGLDRDQARECLRISLGRTTTQEDIDSFVATMVREIARIRSRKTRS